MTGRMKDKYKFPEKYRGASSPIWANPKKFTEAQKRIFGAGWKMDLAENALLPERRTRAYEPKVQNIKKFRLAVVNPNLAFPPKATLQVFSGPLEKEKNGSLSYNMGMTIVEKQFPTIAKAEEHLADLIGTHPKLKTPWLKKRK